MGLGTDIYLNLLGVGELFENIKAVIEDKLGGLDKQRPRPGLEGKTAIVTGGNAGVGYATAEALLQQGTHVVLACRSKERAEAAAAKLEAAVAASPQHEGSSSSRGSRSTGSGGASGTKSRARGRVEVELLDLASLESVRQFVQRWVASGRPLHLLVCNAGIMCPPEREETADGFELQFQSNYLAHFQLANALVCHTRRQRRRQQKATAPATQQPSSSSSSSSQGGDPLRVVMLTSMTHFGGDLASDLADVPYCRRGRYNPFQAYCNSKLATLLAAKHLDRLFARDAGASCASSASSARDVAVAVHPGLVDTFLARNYFKNAAPRLLRPLCDPLLEHLLCPYLLRSPAAAAQTVLYAATAPAEEVGGQYCGTAPHVSRHSADADDPALAQRLWELSAHLCQLSPDDLLS